MEKEILTPEVNRENEPNDREDLDDFGQKILLNLKKKMSD